MDRTLKIQGSDEILTLIGEEGDTVSNIRLQRESGKTVYLTMVDDVTPDGRNIRIPLFMENAKDDIDGKKKIGDVVITLRQHPQSKRWMVRSELENHFIEPKSVVKNLRATRSGADNPDQAIRRKVTRSGEENSNSRRIGGHPIITWFVISGWSPQEEDKMTDVYEYVRCPDSMGGKALLNAMAHEDMPDDVAAEIVVQMRKPLQATTTPTT